MSFPISDLEPLPRILHFVLSKQIQYSLDHERLNFYIAVSDTAFYHEGHEEHEEEPSGSRYELVAFFLERERQGHGACSASGRLPCT